MKRLSTLLLATAWLSLAFADPIKVGDTEITFEPPEGFKEVSQEIIDLKWPTNRAPKFVVGDETASTTVAYDLKPHQIPQDKLGDVQKSFTKLFERIVPGINWKKNEIIKNFCIIYIPVIVSIVIIFLT